MCHVFIYDKTFMPPQLNFDSKSLNEENDATPPPIIKYNKIIINVEI
jgi:hypothetical protein